jgi:putative transposase
MTEYRRPGTPGATWFFTVNLAERHGNTRLITHVDALRRSFALVRRRHPFHIEAIVVLPDHLHCLWRLPDGDADNATRWGLIKAGFSRTLPTNASAPAAALEVSAEYGSEDSGNIRFATMTTTPRMWTTFTTTQSNIATP